MVERCCCVELFVSKVRILYGGSDIFDYEVRSAFWHDIHLAIISVVTIVVLMLILTSFSIWLTFWGVVTIMLSFPLAYFFYRVVFHDIALGMLNGAAAFVVVGIGNVHVSFCCWHLGAIELTFVAEFCLQAAIS